MFITSNKIIKVVAFFILGIFFLTAESILFAEICFLLSFVSIFWDRVSNWLKRGTDEAVKTDGYFPQDKLSEYYKNASKKTAEIIGPDPSNPIYIKTLPHRAPNSAKNFFSELEKIFK